MFTCAACGRRATACPDCVNMMAVDPETGLPPDVAIVDGTATTIEPTPEARERSKTHPLCDACVTAAIVAGKTDMMTAEQRHRLRHL
jgi:hypothetical protein